MTQLSRLYPERFRNPDIVNTLSALAKTETDANNKAGLLALTAVDPDEKAIREVLQKGNKRQELERALTIVRDRHLTAAIPDVMNLLDRQADFFVPELAVETLGEFKLPAVIERLRALLSSPRETLRGRAAIIYVYAVKKEYSPKSHLPITLAEYLHKKNDPHGTEARWNWAEGSASPELQLWALEGLTELGVNTNKAVLKTLTEHEDRTVRLLALNLLSMDESPVP